jgi:hypothetical protein
MIIFRNRGAIVPDETEFIKLHPCCRLVPDDMVKDLVAYSFNCTYQGLPAAKWAWFWLAKKDRRAREVGTAVAVPTTKECKISSRACYLAQKKSQKQMKPTKVKMVGGIYNSSLF